MVYIVSYDLLGKKDYTGLFEQLENSPAWWHYLNSTWLISTGENANQLYNRLRPHLHKDDRILIVQAGTDLQGWLPKDAWEWVAKALGLPLNIA